MNAARLHCDARLSLGPVICRQVVGVHAIVDATGTVRGACSREGHRANVIRRYGQQPLPCCGAGGSTPHWVGCPQHPKAMRPTRCRPDEFPPYPEPGR